jgi:hypothetical protein
MAIECLTSWDGFWRAWVAAEGFTAIESLGYGRGEELHHRTRTVEQTGGGASECSVDSTKKGERAQRRVWPMYGALLQPNLGHLGYVRSGKERHPAHGKNRESTSKPPAEGRTACMQISNDVEARESCKMR